MKQVALRKLTNLDKVEILKNGQFDIIFDKLKHIYKIKIIFKSNDNIYQFISFRLNERDLSYYFRILYLRDFIPKDYLPLNLIEKLHTRNFLYYEKKTPRFTNKYNISLYRYELLETKTTLSLFGHLLLETLWLWINFNNR